MDFYKVSWLIYILCLVISLFSSYYVKRMFNIYKFKKTKSNKNNKNMVDYMIKKHNLNLKVNNIGGELTDFYNPKDRSLNLSGSYDSNNVSSIAVAAHEVGHAIQHEEGYSFMKLRTSLVPIVNLVSTGGYIALVIGLLFSSPRYVVGGIWMEMASLIFSLVTLPVEFNASRRAMAEIKASGYLSKDEEKGAGKVLKAAALTYVASSLVAFLNLARFMMLASSRDDR